METTVEEPTLRDLRIQSKLTLKQILERMAEELPRSPKSHTAILRMEERGTNKLTTIRALSKVYGVPFDVVAGAAARRDSSCASV